MTAFETAAAAADGMHDAVVAAGEPQVPQVLGVQELGARVFVDETIAEVMESIRAVNQKVKSPHRLISYHRPN